VTLKGELKLTKRVEDFLAACLISSRCEALDLGYERVHVGKVQLMQKRQKYDGVKQE